MSSLIENTNTINQNQQLPCAHDLEAERLTAQWLVSFSQQNPRTEMSEDFTDKLKTHYNLSGVAGTHMRSSRRWDCLHYKCRCATASTGPISSEGG